MNILLVARINSGDECKYLLHNVIYRPDLLVKNAFHLLGALKSYGSNIDFLILAKPISAEEIEILKNGLENMPTIICITLTCDGIQRLPGIPIKYIRAEPEAFKKAFLLIEGIVSRKIIDKPHFKKSPIQEAIFVGAGIVNLFVGYVLASQGVRVCFYDSKPAPRTVSNHKSSTLGATFGGEDARIFSFTESRHHFFKKGDLNNSYFRKDISLGGRLFLDPKELSQNDFSWIESFESIPSWLAKRYHEDIVGFNVYSYQVWSKMLKSQANLAQKVGYVKRLYRLYESTGQYNNSIDSIKGEGSFIKELSKEELLESNPALLGGWKDGHIKKAIEVKGFSLNIHKLGFELIEKIKTLGGTFFWNEEVIDILKNRSGKVKYLLLENGKSISSDLVVISPGAYGGKLLSKTSSHNLITSMIGMWLPLPNDNLNLNVPFKLSRTGIGAPGPCESANIIVGNKGDPAPKIFVSSGHGFIGEHKIIDKKQLEVLGQGVVDVSKKLFPEKVAMLEGNASDHLSYCVRPWTPSCLGIFEILETTRGHLVVTGGHNTGGFAQAPAISEAILNLINGSFNDMFTKYHPLRAHNFLSP